MPSSNLSTWIGQPKICQENIALHSMHEWANPTSMEQCVARIFYTIRKKDFKSAKGKSANGFKENVLAPLEEAGKIIRMEDAFSTNSGLIRPW